MSSRIDCGTSPSGDATTADGDVLPYCMNSNTNLTWTINATDSSKTIFVEPADDSVTAMNVVVESGGVIHPNTSTNQVHAVTLAPYSTLTINSGGAVIAESSSLGALAVINYTDADVNGPITIRVNEGGLLKSIGHTLFPSEAIIGNGRGDLNLYNAGTIEVDSGGASGLLIGSTDLTGLSGDGTGGDYISNINNAKTGVISLYGTGVTAAGAVHVSQGSTVRNDGSIIINVNSSDQAIGVESLTGSYNRYGSFINTGSIQVVNGLNSAHGILLRNYINAVNTGTISARGGSTAVANTAVYLNGSSSDTFNNFTFENIGTITASGTSGTVTGVAVDGSYVTFVSRGTIDVGSNNAAISFRGESQTDESVTNSVLKYYTTSNINGKIILADPATNKVELYGDELGLDQVVTLVGAPNVSSPDYSSAYSSSKDGTELVMLNKGHNANIYLASIDSSSLVQTAILNRSLAETFSSQARKPGFNMWVDGHTKDKYRPKSQGLYRMHSKLDGLIFGADKDVSTNGRVGFFFGGLKSKTDVGLNRNMEHKSSGGVIGIYGDNTFNDLLLNGVFELGYIDHKRKRMMYESSLDNSLDKSIARGKNHEFFFSPSITVAKSYKARDHIFVPSLTMRYVGQKISALSEGSGVAEHIVKDRYVSVVGARAQVTTNIELAQRTGLSLYSGLDYSKVLSNKIKLAVGSDRRDMSFKFKRPVETDLLFGAKLSQQIKQASAFMGFEGTKGLKKGDEGKNYSIALNIGADY